ncbi:MAG: TVP38/TMEM64 family protein [Alphaproteobacteria bacterium]|nr:TVP38/TMEM64 family protein [Alphaproteobacteria bacterium]
MTVIHEREEERRAKARARRLRAAALVVIFGGIYLAMHASGLLETVTIEWVQARVAEAGPWGKLAFVGVFIAGVLLYIPGFVFVVAGVMIFGPVTGGLLCWATGLVASHAAFFSTRFIGGDTLTGAEQPFIQRMMAKVEERPIATTALLRTFLYLSPPANIALALSPVSFRQHLIGTLLGFTPVTLGYALFTDVVVAWLRG